ncbi:hypothetical protein D4764_13G0007760 [Takifugu flavidus]|uniref:Uncharacterized protein n=1 Tax=Takifugu flavidus TaxID=433684 RepID=A0A5C6P8H7_9TELE|nr:hypothetical protein D4764_13G0007760 [Takifugu flavidus]
MAAREVKSQRRLLSRMAAMKEQQITEEKPLLPEQRGPDSDAVSPNVLTPFVFSGGANPCELCWCTCPREMVLRICHDGM